MGNIHISPGLDPNQCIFRPISFYDLIELITFSQMTFAQSGKAGVMHQSWNLLNHENSLDWSQNTLSAASLYLVSSVDALSTSLFPDQAINVFIEQTRRVVHFPGYISQVQTDYSPASQTSHPELPTIAPALEDQTVSVIVNATNHINTSTASPIRLLVDLGKLLTGVIVYPDAPLRFVELVSQLVQRTTRAFVSRAGMPYDLHASNAMLT